MPLPGGYLLDTNILIDLIRGNALGQYLDKTYGLTAGENPFILCIVTVGEMYALSAKFKWGAAKKAALASLLAQFVWTDISDPAVLQAYGDIDAASEAVGRKMGKNDVWIAATAQVTNTTILTTDPDFDHLHGAWVDREGVDPTSKLGS
jgi:tRNA(fMet)-specific endonuclease VapC